jgi:hypothetical protein
MYLFTYSIDNSSFSDVHHIQEAIGDRFGMLIQGLIQFLVGFAISLARGWKLALVIIALSPLVIVSLLSNSHSIAFYRVCFHGCFWWKVYPTHSSSLRAS